MWVNPALMHSTAPGHWEAEIISRRLSPLLEEDLERAVEEAGWALNGGGSIRSMTGVSRRSRSLT